MEVPRRLMTFLEVDVPDGTLNGEQSPFILTDSGTYTIRGQEVKDGEVLAQMFVPAHETVIEVPRRLMSNLAKEVAWSG
ncbi:MAG: hypothetical protein ACRDPK_00370 [Carbonactinosporaceae bacterium]